MKKITIILIALCAMFTAQGATVTTDVCVYGESASGVMAAIQAARLGKKTVLVSKNSHVGGLATSGLTATDINRQDQVGGLAAEFYGRIWDYYIRPEVWRNQTREQFMESSRKRTFSGKNDDRQIQWVYESGVAERKRRFYRLEFSEIFKENHKSHALCRRQRGNRCRYY